jgi:phage host-nuclease inhibitor protein Gam
MNRVKDLRITTLEQAKQLMAALAKLTTTIELLKARANSKISTIKTELQEKLSPLESEKDLHGAALGEFIQANRGLFVSPRKVKCEGGSFGLQAATGVEISDEAKLMEHLMENGYDDCYVVTRTPDKKAIESRLKAGCALPGVALAKGDTVVYKVDPQLLKEAKSGTEA